jgi:dihydrofolate reductase
MKSSAERDLTIGGAELAGRAIAAGLIDEQQLLLAPVLVGAGKRALPADVRADLELLDHRRFANGFVYLRHRYIG